MCVPRNNQKKFMAHKDSKLEYKNRTRNRTDKFYGGKNNTKKNKKNYKKTKHTQKLYK